MRSYVPLRAIHFPGGGHHPGGGRGPIGCGALAYAARGYLDLSNWAPAFAGVVGGVCDLVSHRRPPPPIRWPSQVRQPTGSVPASHSPQNKIVTQQTRHPTKLRHPSESWGLAVVARELAARDPSFRWGDGRGAGMTERGKGRDRRDGRARTPEPEPEPEPEPGPGPAGTWIATIVEMPPVTPPGGCEPPGRGSTGPD